MRRTDAAAMIDDLRAALTAARARNAELEAALREMLADIPEPHAKRHSYIEAFITPDVIRRARTTLARTPDQAAQRLAALERVAEAARTVGLETECIVTPPCGGCRACDFRAALDALAESDHSDPAE